jgi:hypothetical protein
MSAQIYTISSLLEGQSYKSRSRKIEGTIVHAEIADEIWYGENTYAYRVRVRPNYSRTDLIRDEFWATLAVRKEN